MRIKKWGVFFVVILKFYSLMAQADSTHYSVFINPALDTGFLCFNMRIYLIENDEIKVLNENGKGTYPSFKKMFKNDSTRTDSNSKLVYRYDTTSFSMNKTDRLKVIQTLESIQCLDPLMDNPRIIDGLRWFLVCELGKKSYSTFIGNTYHEKIAVFARIINKYVPKEWMLWYENESPLAPYAGKCN